MSKHLTLSLPLFILAILLSFSFVAGQPSSSSLERQAMVFNNSPAMKHGQWAFYVVDLTNNSVIFAHQEHLSLAPASVQKLITTITALSILGPDYRYITHIQRDGFVDAEGTLHGNIYIKGSGDPGLGSSSLEGSLDLNRLYDRWGNEIRNSGIKKITGNVIADDSAFDSEMVPRKWLWEDIGNYFGAGSSALSVNENEYTVYFNAGTTLGSPARIVSTKPNIPGMTLVNNVTTGAAGSGDQVYIFGGPYAPERWLTGTVPLGARNFAVRGSIPDPPMFAATTFHSFLTQKGIRISGDAISSRLASLKGHSLAMERQKIASTHSPPLSVIVDRTNMRSVNMYAENLLKTIGLYSMGKGDFSSGISAILEFWEKQGLDTKGMRLHDGSGLSPSNRVTASQIGMMLAYAAQQDYFDILFHSLPLAGHSGSLRPMFHGTNSFGILRAKSGFLSNVRAYAGYTRMKNDTPVAFVLLVNDFDGTPIEMRNNMEKLLDAISD